MKFSKILMALMAALALAACGGGGGGSDSSNSGGGGGSGGGGNDGGGGEAVQPTSHLYHTLDFTAAGNFLQARTTQVPHYAESGVIRLGNADVKFHDVNDELVIEGYRFLQIEDTFTPDEGAMVLCKDNAPDSTIWHALLPAKAQEVQGSVDAKLAKLIAAQRLDFFEECNTTEEVFVVAADGSFSMEIGGEPATGEDDSATPAHVRAMLSDQGGVSVDEDDGETLTTWLRLYESEGRLYVVIIDRTQAADGSAPEYEIMMLIQQNRPA
ncbi:hypothetical protein H0484_00440 [Pusillimonas sp. CC-YST705]|uniref:Lipoprotein n=1 Tax=Mesopusillimonas faecipullorum TaxID=2755040 RepID=A0ABS8C890_9BURK|nr:hypothetical protein [Mesopusillimonas faecipullorum]MCB5362231.1 hypothetical protein [Mesopusillimonas faecipullorum]